MTDTNSKAGGAVGTGAAGAGAGAAAGTGAAGTGTGAAGAGAVGTQANQIIIDKQIKARSQMIEEFKVLHKNLGSIWNSSSRLQDGVVMGQCVALNSILHTMIAQQQHLVEELKNPQGAKPPSPPVK